jgi:hypothetical protein
LGLRTVWGCRAQGRVSTPLVAIRRDLSPAGGDAGPVRKNLAFFVFFEKNKLKIFECQQILATKTPDNGAFWEEIKNAARVWA